MSRKTLVLLLALSTLSVAYRHYASRVPTLRLLVKASVESELKDSGATYRLEKNGFSIKADAEGARALHELRARHLAARDASLEVLRKAREDGAGYSFAELQVERRQPVAFDAAALAREAKRARAEESLASTYDRALRKMEQLDSSLIVEHVDLVEDGSQLLEEIDSSSLQQMFDAK